MSDFIRNSINRAMQAIAENDESEDEFDSILQTTRRNFRPRNEVRRGRKPTEVIKKKTFLVRRSNIDYFPIKSECESLTSQGLGYSKESPKFQTKWSRERFETYIYSLYPDIPLELVGFRTGKLDKKRKIIPVNIGDNLQDFKELIGSSHLIIIPHRDIPERRWSNNHQLNSRRSSNEVTDHQLEARQSNEIIDHQEQRESNNDLDELDRNPRSREVQDYHYITEGANNGNLLEPAQSNNIEESESSINFDEEVDASIDLTLTEDVNTENLGNNDFFDSELVLSDEVMEIQVNRNNVFQHMLKLYEDNSIVFKQLKVSFIGELGDDFGGLTKELFTIFWQECRSMYFKGEQKCVPHLHLHKKRSEMQNFVKIGRILTHTMLLTGVIPNNITRTTYLLLSNPDRKIPSNIIKEDYLYFVTVSERQLLTKAEKSFESLKPFEKDLLIDFLQTENFFEMPTKDKFSEQLLTIAENRLCIQPLEFIKLIKSGIPYICESFWDSLDVAKLHNILIKQIPTADKVIQILQPSKEDLTNHEAATLYYLKTFVRSLDKEGLLKFLFFVTGSDNLPKNIKVSFIKMVGLIRRPIAHTCANLLELSSSYLDYQDFSTEFKAVLSSDTSYEYTQM